MSITITLENESGDEETHELPTKFEVCWNCEGHGTHLAPAIREHAYTAEEFEESFDDEGRAEYFRHGGIYDVMCTECRGQRVLEVLDEEATAALPNGSDLLQALEDQEHAERADALTCAAERRMGC